MDTVNENKKYFIKIFLFFFLIGMITAAIYFFYFLMHQPTDLFSASVDAILLGHFIFFIGVFGTGLVLALFKKIKITPLKEFSLYEIKIEENRVEPYDWYKDTTNPANPTYQALYRSQHHDNYGRYESYDKYETYHKYEN